MSSEHKSSFASSMYPGGAFPSTLAPASDLPLAQAAGQKEDELEQEFNKPNYHVPSSPQKQIHHPLVSTPYKAPEVVSIANAFTPSSGACGNFTNAERVFNLSPSGAFMAKSHASPFIPFCRDNLSPLCNVEGNFTSSNSKRVLFSPVPGNPGHEERIKATPQPLLAEENICSLSSPEVYIPMSIPRLFQRGKSPIRRLNFDSEAPQLVQTNSVPVEINKVRNFKRFISSEAKVKTEEIQNDDHKSETRFYQLKNSPMQMFNSFSPTSAPYLAQTIVSKAGHGGLIYSDGKIVNKKACCNCKKSHCLKLYCECFASKTYCQGCNCVNCLNTRENEALREKAMQATLERNPNAFDPKITQNAQSGVTKSTVQLQHARGCHCKRSGCLKKYCECYQSGACCTDLCKCEGCKNRKEENPLAEIKMEHTEGAEDERMQTPFSITKRKRAEKSGKKRLQLTGKRQGRRKGVKKCFLESSEEFVHTKQRGRRVRAIPGGIEAS